MTAVADWRLLNAQVTGKAVIAVGVGEASLAVLTLGVALVGGGVEELVWHADASQVLVITLQGVDAVLRHVTELASLTTASQCTVTTIARVAAQTLTAL